MSDDQGVERLPEVDLLAAALRLDHADLDLYSQVLLSSLADAFPPDLVEVERERSLSARLSGRPGQVARLRIVLGTWSLELERARNGLRALAARVVRGVAISRKEVSLEEWTVLLATELRSAAAQSEKARGALARLLGTS